MRFFIVWTFLFFRVSSLYMKIKPLPNSLQKFTTSWYVVGEARTMKPNRPCKITLWSNDYVVWKTENNTYHALQDICPHRGVSLSSGKLENDHLICPYHGYKYDENGILKSVPGMSFQPCEKYNVKRYAIVEKGGWIYMNTYELPSFATNETVSKLSKYILMENEQENRRGKMSCILLSQYFQAHPRIVSENSLDIMHIAYVHTFGNKERPAPTYEDPPKEIRPNHWRTSYVYESGAKSMISKIFNLKKIIIENEFIMPHTTIARIKFGNAYINTIVTSACPINENKTMLYVKNYRNFFSGHMFNTMFHNMMVDTLLQDKGVIETIKNENMDGKYNMKFDKLQNTYTSLYKKKNQ